MTAEEVFAKDARAGGSFTRRGDDGEIGDFAGWLVMREFGADKWFVSAWRIKNKAREQERFPVDSAGRDAAEQWCKGALT